MLFSAGQVIFKLARGGRLTRSSTVLRASKKHDPSYHMYIEQSFRDSNLHRFSNVVGGRPLHLELLLSQVSCETTSSMQISVYQTVVAPEQPTLTRLKHREGRQALHLWPYRQINRVNIKIMVPIVCYRNQPLIRLSKTGYGII